jgi:mRNA interferase RelE/StbE
MSFELRLKKSAEKELKQIKGTILYKVDSTLRALTSEPRPKGALKIRGENNLFRIRCGDYRIIYEVNQKLKQIEVVTIANRKNAYRRIQ